ncbi:MAG: T9SS type A sorting domain-containing protein [Flavobacteriales bacterium]|nr:T9SS type A sorting domain-containing protein [Flavobacteriales bacterium]
MVSVLFPLLTHAQYFNNRYPIDSSSAATAFNAIENDSGYLMVGGFAPFGYYASLALIQTDFNGTELFQKIYKTNTVPYYAGSKGSLQKVNGEGYIMYGSTYNGSKIRDLLYRFNDVGDTLWTKQLSDTTFDYIGRQVKETSDGGFICIGDRGVSFAPIFIIKTDSLGNKQWEKFYGGSQYDLPTSIAVCSDGGYIYCTTTKSGGVGLPTYYNIRVMKVDSLGNMVFNKFYGDLYNDNSHTIIQTQDGGYIVSTAYAIDTTTGVRTYASLLKLDSSGNLLWLKKVMPIKGNGPDSFQTVLELSDGSLVAAGLNHWTDSIAISRYHGLVVKTTPQGDIIWQREHQLSTCNTCDSYLYDIRTTSDGGFICSGVANSPQEMWLLKLDSLGCADTACALAVGVEAPKSQKGTFNVYPNPANSFIMVESSGTLILSTFRLVDITGKEVLSKQINSSYTQIDIQNLSKGIYFYVVTNEKERFSGKLIIN